MSSPSKCPACGVTWEADETIYEYFLREGQTPEEAAKTAKMYGCTPETPKHFGMNVVGIYDMEKDRTVSWKCTSCDVETERR